MKKFQTILFAIFCLIVLSIPQTISAHTAAKRVYLNNLIQVDKHGYKVAKDFIYDIINMGGVSYKQGFGLFTTYGPTKPGYVEYSLKGKYKSLSFVIGTYTSDDQNYSKALVHITGDGKRIYERMVAGYDVPQQVQLDVSGIDKLRFEIVQNDVNIGIADPISVKTNPVDKLLIGADGNVVETIDVYDNMKPTTYTVPIGKARQLMFWLQCGDWGSGQFIFYDLKLSKGNPAPASAKP